MKGLLAVLMVLMSATAACAEIYTWKDNTGTRFYTNSLHEIPARYLKKARVLDVATGKLGGLATAQPPTPAAPAAAGRSAAPAPQPLLVQAPSVQPTAAPEPPHPPQAAAPQAPGTPAAAAASPAAPVAERAPAAQNSTRPPGRLSRRELRAQSRRSNSTGDE
ncbi:DUF4124 domain-containing protein [Geomonas paludis]|uniref:DUF4124 domain-containing protein n=1 Tax=Geomonas paludis TaxID=2740185 RepID=A0A6V8MR72_9BACT|nr:DUF4124 domain-containing protein [Geomonas paludis]UPU35820.1 DUF4124 domain-containing protein [Geomonas paludis]GFO62598.1 hypothetical protein GMPD_05170 [Geomonas paludis]